MGEVQALLAPLFDERQSRSRGTRTTVILLIAALVAFLNYDWVRKYAPIFVIVGSIASMSIGFGCFSCGGASNVILAATPVLGLLFFSFTGLCLVTSLCRPRVLHYLGVLASFVPMFQAGILFWQPKLCLACVIAGASAIFLAQGLLSVSSAKTNSMPAQLPLAIGRGAALLSVLALSRSLLVGCSFLDATPSRGEAPSLLGRKIASYVSSRVFRPGPYLLTSAGCNACSAARIVLAENNVRVPEIRVCTGVTAEPCFRPGSDSVRTPLFFAVDPNGTIVWEHLGWPSYSDQKSLISEINHWRNEYETRP